MSVAKEYCSRAPGVVSENCSMAIQRSVPWTLFEDVFRFA